MNTPDYNSTYYALHKAAIAAQRRARRLAMSEQEREEARERERRRSRKHAAKQKAENELMRVELAELVTITKNLADMLEDGQSP